MIYRLFLCALCCISNLAQAAPVASSAPLSLQHYNIESWGTLQGLPHSSINDITQSPEGYIWLATWEGPVRFNGREFKTFNRRDTAALTNPGIRRLHITATGTLLFGGVNGNVISLNAGQWQSFMPANSMVFDILALSEDHYLLATAGSGLLQIRQQQLQRQLNRRDGLPSEYIYTVKQARSGQLLLATAQGLLLLDQELNPASMQQLFAGTEVYALLADNSGGIYAATAKGVFYAPLWQTQPEFTQLSDIPAATLLLDNYRQLWFGGVSNDIYRLHNGRAEPLRLDNDLSANRVLSLFLDRENNIWAGTSNGLKRIREVPFTNLTRYHGLQDNFVRTVLESRDGSLWIGSIAGLDRQTPDGHIEPVLEHTSVLSLAEGEDGSIWAGTQSQGVMRIRQQQLSQHFHSEHGLLSANVRSITVRGDQVWLGTANGLHMLDSNSGKITHFTTSASNSFILSQLWLSDGSLLLGTNESAGIWRDNQFRLIGDNTTFSPRRVLSFYQAPGSHVIWLATDKGLGRYLPAQDKLSFIALEAELPSETILQVIQDDVDSLWLSTNRGIIRIKLADAMAYLDGQVSGLPLQLFNEKDGMRNAQTNGGSNPATLKRRDGSLVFATAGGATEIQPGLLSRFALQPPQTRVESLAADGRLLPLSTGAVTVPAGTERLAIHLAGLGFVAPERIQFRTRLEGFDKQWNERSNLSVIEYTKLPPGEYNLQAAAEYAGGQWSQHISLPIVVEPFIWQRKLFWFVIIAIALIVAERLLYLRTRRARQRAAELEQLVAEKTQVLQKQTDHLMVMDKERQQLLGKIQQQAEFFAAQARQDTLTGLHNRRAFGEQAEQEFKRIQRYPHPLSIAITDIDHFKSINDTYSHATGDAVLQRVAGVLARYCRETDLVARWGGEEFVLLFTETSAEQAVALCDTLRQHISGLSFTDLADDLQVTTSFGVAGLSDETGYERLLARADNALYQAKASGRNKVVCDGM